MTQSEEIKRLTIIIQSVRTCDDGDCLPCDVCLAAMRTLVVEGASANALEDAQRKIERLKEEIAEDVKATAESQEITGKYMDDAESAQREIAELKLERQRFENAALDAVTAAQQDQAKIERAEALIRQMLEEWRALAAQRDRTMIGPPDMDLRSYGTGANRAFNETANFAGEQIKAAEKYLEGK